MTLSSQGSSEHHQSDYGHSIQHSALLLSPDPPLFLMLLPVSNWSWVILVRNTTPPSKRIRLTHVVAKVLKDQTPILLLIQHVFIYHLLYYVPGTVKILPSRGSQSAEHKACEQVIVIQQHSNRDVRKLWGLKRTDFKLRWQGNRDLGEGTGKVLQT